MRGKRAELMLWIAVFAAGVILIVASAIVGLIFLPPIWATMLFFTVMFGTSAGWHAFLIWRSLHLRQIYFAADGRFCPHCGQSILGLGDEGTCPECGNAFEYSDVQRQWRSIIGEERRKKKVPADRV